MNGSSQAFFVCLCVVANLSILLRHTHKIDETDKCVGSFIVFLIHFSVSHLREVFYTVNVLCRFYLLFFLLLWHQTALLRNAFYCLLPLLELCTNTDKHARIELSGENVPAGYNFHPRLTDSYLHHTFLVH